MPKPSKQVVTLCIIVLALAVIFGIKYTQGVSPEGSAPAILAKTKGSSSAPLKVVEYIDFQCPACAQGALYLKEFMAKNPDVVQLQMKYFPLGSIHKHAFESAKYGECGAAQDKFWPVHDFLIERQNQWKNLMDATPAFELMAVELGLDLNQLSACLEDEKIVKTINADKADGKTLGVRSTPTYFINGEIAVGYKNLIVELNKFIKGNTN